MRSPHSPGDERPSKRAIAQASRLAARQALTPLAFNVLRRLDAGAFVSGVRLARELAVSRSTVWHAVQAISRAGVAVSSSRGRGYRLLQSVVWVDAERVNATLGRAARVLHLTVLDHCESTNTALARQAEAGAAHGTVLLAEWQTAGRGRFDRRWASAPGAALTFSLLWRFERGPAHLSGLSLVAGVAIAEALRALGLREVNLAWPNDVMLRRRKLAGVLTEIKGDMLGPCAAVIGIGLNVQLPKSVLDTIDQPATDLARAGLADLDRNAILAALLSALASALERFARDGFSAFRQQWQACSASQQRPVRVVLPDGEVVRGRMLGVDDQGALRIDTGQAVRRVFSGELTPRSGTRATSRAGAVDPASKRPEAAPHQARIE
jgi:BirA family transcriptional regulator, biotin operon repressor / biotin---[acetyl-CoA-carboxylase] ligase